MCLMIVVAENVHKRDYCNEQEHSNDKTTQNCGANPVHIEPNLQAQILSLSKQLPITATKCVVQVPIQMVWI